MSRALLAAIGGIHRLSDGANRLVEPALFALGFGMALLTGIQVLCRYGLNHSLFWSEEVGRICLVWITFLGASAAYKRRAHLGIDFLTRRLPPNWQLGCELLVLTASLFFFLVLTVFGARFALFVSGQKTSALGISLALPYLVIPASGVLFTLHALSRLGELWQRTR